MDKKILWTITYIVLIFLLIGSGYTYSTHSSQSDTLKGCIYFEGWDCQSTLHAFRLFKISMAGKDKTISPVIDVSLQLKWLSSNAAKDKFIYKTQNMKTQKDQYYYQDLKDKIIKEIPQLPIDPIESLSLSPDGTRIVYSSYASNKKYQYLPLADIYIYDLKAGKNKQITSNDRHNILPVWSPDGKWIAFYSITSAINNIDNFPPDTQGYALCIMDNQGNYYKEIAPPNYLSSFYLNYPPQWHPTGSKIMFLNKTLSGGESIPMDLCQVDTNGKNYQILRSPGGAYPSWSPDGYHILFTENKIIKVINLKTNEENIISGDSSFKGVPIWSPDGKHIMFSTATSLEFYDLNNNKKLRSVSLDNIKPVDSKGVCYWVTD